MATVTVKLSTWKNGANPTITLTQPGLPDANGVLRPDGLADLTSQWINAQAVVTLTGTPGERVDFYKFGFIQLKFITDDWAHYRGQTAADGSVFLAMDRPPARPQQLCRDSLVGQGNDIPLVGPLLFYDGDRYVNIPADIVIPRKTAVLLPNAVIPPNGTLTLILLFSDSPERGFVLRTVNNQFAPGRQNFLYSLQTGAAYATMFAVQRGAGRPIEVLKTFQWNVRWRAHFRRNAAGVVQQELPGRKGDIMDMNVSKVFEGAPTDIRFLGSVDDITLPVCNPMVRAAFANAVRTESPGWSNYDVRH